ncbi:MAG: hypothetical protein HY675_04230 [Chloroflexi bacterium]|nr:hypothetical protein [Chloroflexota bacterium]
MSSGTAPRSHAYLGVLDVGESLHQTTLYLAPDALSPFREETLLSYVRDYDWLLNKSLIEWRLSRSLLDAEGGRRGELRAVSLPVQACNRVSGAMLQWVINQCTRTAAGLPGRLARGPSLSDAQAVLFARGWVTWPQNPMLTEHRRLFDWMEPHQAALGWTAIALAEGGDRPLARDAVLKWLQGPMGDPNEVAIFGRLLAFPELRSLGEVLLRRAVLAHGSDAESLAQLCRLAFAHELYAVAAEAAATFSLGPEGARCLHVGESEKEPDSEQWNDLEAIQIASLARVGRHEDALVIYRRHWFETEKVFPYPSKLLPSLSGQKLPYRLHLASHCDGRDCPLWAQLELKNSRGVWKDTLSDWFALLQQSLARAVPRPKESEAGQDPQDAPAGEWPRLLSQEEDLQRCFLSLTEALIRVLPEQPSPYSQWVRKHWELLVQPDPGGSSTDSRMRNVLRRYAQLALVALAAGPEERIRLYEQWALGEVSLKLHWLVPHAARGYLDALVQLALWPRLRAFVDRHFGEFEALRTACPYPEPQFYRLLASVTGGAESAMSRGREWGDRAAWCANWAELVSLPLTLRQLRVVLAHFVNTRDVLARSRHPIVQSENFRNLELILVRHGKAVAGQLLRNGRNALPANTVDWNALDEGLREVSARGLSEFLGRPQLHLLAR